MKYLLVLVSMVVSVVSAQAACPKIADNIAHICITPVTLDSAGNPLRTGAAISYTIQRQSGSTWVTETTITGTDWQSAPLQPGTYSYRLFATADGVAGDISDTKSKTVVSPKPGIPTWVIAVVIGVDHAPVYTILKDGSRSSTLAGFAPVGSACNGPVLFKYRGREWREPVEWKAWDTATSTKVAAPCVQAAS